MGLIKHLNSLNGVEKNNLNWRGGVYANNFDYKLLISAIILLNISTLFIITSHQQSSIIGKFLNGSNQNKG